MTLKNIDYMFNYSESEIRRIKSQADILRPITQRLLISAGVQEGMRVLDIGCGAGDVTMMIANLVGPTGRVVGIDRDEVVVDAARDRLMSLGYSNVKFMRGDVESYSGVAGFDAAVCRYVLIHQPVPARFLRAVGGLVRPGGVVAVHELDATRGVQSNPRIPLLHEAYELIQRAFTQMDVAGDAGGRLVALFADAGLPLPQLFTETVIASGDDPMLLPWFADILREVMPRLVSGGAASQDAIDLDTLTERLRTAAADSHSQVEFVPQMCGWTRV